MQKVLLFFIIYFIIFIYGHVSHMQYKTQWHLWRVATAGRRDYLLPSQKQAAVIFLGPPFALITACTNCGIVLINVLYVYTFMSIQSHIMHFVVIYIYKPARAAPFTAPVAWVVALASTISSSTHAVYSLYRPNILDCTWTWEVRKR